MEEATGGQVKEANTDEEAAEATAEEAAEEAAEGGAEEIARGEAAEEAEAEEEAVRNPLPASTPHSLAAVASPHAERLLGMLSPMSAKMLRRG